MTPREQAPSAWLLRTLLFVAGNNARMLEKARSLRPDALIFDLEDAVPNSEKEAARRMVAAALSECLSARVKVFVRVNPLSRRAEFEADLEAVLAGNLHGICLPKCDRPEAVAEVGELLAAGEKRCGKPVGSIALVPMIESALGLINAYSIARADPRIAAVAFGGEDFCADMGIARSREGRELLYPRSALAVSARAAGCQAIDTIYADLNDTEGLARETRLAKQLGFTGKLIIHPAQIEPVHRAFAPSEEEVAEARRIVEAFERAAAAGSGVVVVDGRMVDRPMVLRAQRILALAEADG